MSTALAAEARPHPAKFNDPILKAMDKLLPREGRLIDVFAGVGRIHELGRDSVGIEIEEEWAFQHPQNRLGDSTQLCYPDESFDMAATSCSYANRMSDHHNNQDPCKKCQGSGMATKTLFCKKCLGSGKSRRYTYKYYLGHDLHPNNTGAYGWSGKEKLKYQQLHEAVWAELRRVLKPGTPFVLNVSNHIRKKEEVDVVGWHHDTLVGLGFLLAEDVKVDTPRSRDGANRDARVGCEHVRRYVRI